MIITKDMLARGLAAYDLLMASPHMNNGPAMVGAILGAAFPPEPEAMDAPEPEPIMTFAPLINPADVIVPPDATEGLATESF